MSDCKCSICRSQLPKDDGSSENYKQLDEHAKALRALAEQRGWKKIGSGAYRDTFLSPSGRFVYKVPHAGFAIYSNRREHELFRGLHNTDGGYNKLDRRRFARCRLAPSGILVMELVRPPREHRHVNGHAQRTTKRRPPRWADVLDKAQVGLNREQRWVAYDYGNE